jgi:hypothetical protein
MAISYATTTINNQLDEITADIGASGLLRIYDGTRATDPDTAIGAQNLLAELPLSATAAPAASGGVLTFSTITDDTNANATGTASWFRVTTSGGTGIIDGDVGTSGSDLNLNSVSITAGGTVSVTSFVITGGNA